MFANFKMFCFFIWFAAAASGQIGLAILNSLYLIDYAQSGMRQSAELENQMTSVERIIEYANLPSEPSLESDEKNMPPKDWPQHGNIAFKSLNLRYVANGHRVLRNMTFHIDAKVGVHFFRLDPIYLKMMTII